MKIFIGFLTILFSTFLLSGCQNTAEGLNKDITKNTREIRKEINS